MASTIKWSKKFEKCCSCETTEHKHHARGLCTRCYQAIHEYPNETCNVCGNLSRVHKRIDGQPICSKCYCQPEHTCVICQKKSSAALKLDNNQFVCDPCYVRHYREKHLCSKCGKYEILAINLENEKVCIKCYSSPNKFCSKCGRAINSPYIIGNKHVCSRCYESNRKKPNDTDIDISKREYECSICGKLNSIKKLYGDGSVICPECYNSKMSVCYLCKNPDLEIYSYLKALPHCRQCFYKEKLSTLLDNQKAVWGESFCAIIESFFSAKSKYVSFETLLCCFEESYDVFNILSKQYSGVSPHFRANDLVLIYETFPTKKVFLSDFTSFLCYENKVTDFESSLNLFKSISNLLNELPADMRKAIEMYKKHLLARLAKFKERGWVGKDSRFNFYTCYLYLLTAIRFFSFLYNTLKLSHSTQISNVCVDYYLSEKAYDKGNLRHFIRFLNKNKLTFVILNLPSSNYSHKLQIGLNEDQQSQIFDFCSDKRNDIPFRDKFLVFLMLIFGLTPDDIRNLRKDNFISKKEKSKQELVFIYNKREIKIPQAMSKMLSKYIRSTNDATGYMFPGRLYNRPLSLSTICNIIKKFNTTARELYYTSVNNSIMNGLTQPALIAKMFGISPNTAIRYYKFIEGYKDF